MFVSFPKLTIYINPMGTVGINIGFILELLVFGDKLAMSPNLLKILLSALYTTVLWGKIALC